MAGPSQGAPTMMRKQEEGAENGFKSPRFSPSAGKTAWEERARGENEGQRRVRGKKDKDRNSGNSCKKDHQGEQCDLEGTYVSKPLPSKSGCAWSQERAEDFSHCYASAPAAGGQPSWPEIEAFYPKSVSCVTAGVILSLGPRSWDGWWYAGVINNTGWGMLPWNRGFLHADFWGQRDL